MTRRIPRANTFVGITVLVYTVAPLFLIVRELTAQTALTVPAGLPDWAFNIPDKIQPTAVRPEGIVRAPGSTKEYDASTIAGNANPPDWFPDEHPAAPRSLIEHAHFECAHAVFQLRCVRRCKSDAQSFRRKGVRQ